MQFIVDTYEEIKCLLPKPTAHIDYTVWHENFTWNLILWFYSQWQNRKIKICKLDTNLVYITTRSRTKLGFRKISIPTTFYPYD